MRKTFDHSSEAKPMTRNSNHALRRRSEHIAELTGNHHTGVTYQRNRLASASSVFVNYNSQIDTAYPLDVSVVLYLRTRHLDQVMNLLIHPSCYIIESSFVDYMVTHTYPKIVVDECMKEVRDE